MKKKYKLISILEIFLLFISLFIANDFIKRSKCKDIQCKIVDDRDKIIDLEDFQDLFKNLQHKKIAAINLKEVKDKLKENKIVDKVVIFKEQNSISITIKPRRILGIIYRDYIKQEEVDNNKNSEEECPKNDFFIPEFILENGDTVPLKIKESSNFIPIIFKQEINSVDDLLKVLKFIYDHDEIKSIINTILLKENDLYVTTILNDCIINLGSFLDVKSVIYKMWNIGKIAYLSNDYSYIEFNDESLFLNKRKMR